MKNQTSGVSGIFIFYLVTCKLRLSLFLLEMLVCFTWLIVGIVHMTFYVITFITGVVNGVRSDVVLLLVGVAITSGYKNQQHKMMKIGLNIILGLCHIWLTRVNIGLLLVLNTLFYSLYYFHSAEWSYCLCQLMVSAIESDGR